MNSYLLSSSLGQRDEAECERKGVTVGLDSGELGAFGKFETNLQSGLFVFLFKFGFCFLFSFLFSFWFWFVHKYK